MGELWDIYNIKKEKIGKFAERGNYEFEEGEYHLVVDAFILNRKNEILITRRAPNKRYGLMWEGTGGSALAGESGLEAVLREIKEEIGVNFTKKEAIFLKETRRDDKKSPRFKELWIFKKDIYLNELVFADGEVVDAKWVTIDEYIDMYNKEEIVPTIDFTREDYDRAVSLQQRDSYKYIGKIVKVKIDRTLNSKHPKHGFIYEVNYGFVPNTVSGDGEELDAYILGVNESLQEFEGECIAVIHRTNDDDDKLIIAPKGIKFTDEEIIKLTYFQEQYFESIIIR